MHVSTIAAAALLTLAALTPADANAQGAPYKALGTEPFWSLTIDGKTIRFESPDSRPVTIAKPRPIIGINGELYSTRRLSVDITHVPCSDGMSDRTYRDTVRVTVNGRKLSGCGGSFAETPAPNSPVAGSWQVQSIAGRPVVRGSHVSLSFEGGRVTGNTGCNRLNGPYRFERGALTAGPLITTKRACVGKFAMAQERNLLDLLGKRLSVSRSRNGKLVLTARGGRTLVLAPVRGRR